MRTGLIIFGVIFLVIGGLLYLVPIQQIKAGTTTVGQGNVDTRTSSASLTVPTEWAYASAIIGLVLLMLGFAISNTTTRSNSKEDSYNEVADSRVNIEVRDKLI